jgi:hypothetical protein
MALNTFKYINVYYNKGDKKPYDVNGKPIAYLGQDFVGANEATIVRFYIGSDTGVINAVADVKRPDGEKAFALLDKVNTAEGVAWEFPLTDWFCAKAGKLTIAFKAFNGVVTIVNNTIQSNNLRVIVSDIFNIDIGYAPNSVEDAPPFNPNDISTIINALSNKLDKVSGINVVEALPTPTDGSLNGRWFLLKSGGGTVFPYIESSESIFFSQTAPNPIEVNPGDYWYNPTTNVLSFALNSFTWAPVSSTNGTITPLFGDSAGLYFVNTFSLKLFITETSLLKDIGRLYVFNFNTPVEVELGVETLKLKSNGNEDINVGTNAGKMYWDSDRGTTIAGLYDDQEAGVGDSLFFFGKATEAIAKGEVVQFAGNTGGNIRIKKAVFAEISAQPDLLMGVAKHNIANDDFGYVTAFGYVRNLNTSGNNFSTTQPILYLSTTIAGQLTFVKPTTGFKGSIAAVARFSSGGNNGFIIVRPNLVKGLSELADVTITTATNGNVLSYDGTKWVNSTRLTTAETDIDALEVRMTTEEANVDNLQGRMTIAEDDIDQIEDGTTVVPKAMRDQNGNIINTTYLTIASGASTYVPLSQKGSVNGVATLGIDGRVLPSQLPGSIGEVLEYDTKDDFPVDGGAERIYIAKDTNITYRWTGTQYVPVIGELALGETSESAYRGDRGKEAYDYSQVGHLPLAGGTITNDLIVGGNLKVGQVGSLQTVATRTDDGTIANRGITYFNTSTNRLENNANIVIDSDNKVGIGTASPAQKLHIVGSQRIEHTIDATLQFIRSGANSFSIEHDVNKLYFYNMTTTIAPFTILNNGNFGIGTTSPAKKLDVKGDIAISVNSKLGAGLNFGDDLQIHTGTIELYNNSSGNTTINNTGFSVDLQTASLSRLRITNGGDVVIGTPTAGGTGGWTFYPTGSVASPYVAINKTQTGSTRAFDFLVSGTSAGSINWTSTATSYLTSSDYRLKKNIQPMTNALEKIFNLKPVTYKWKTNDSDGQGFIAHELQEVFPEAVSGNKDEVDENDKPRYQGIDTSFLIATLVKAIQELKEELELLKAKVG